MPGATLSLAGPGLLPPHPPPLLLHQVVLVKESLTVWNRTISVVFGVCKIYLVFLVLSDILNVDRVFRIQTLCQWVS